MNMNQHPIKTVLRGTASPMYAHRSSHWLKAFLIFALIPVATTAWSADVEPKKDDKAASVKKPDEKKDENKDDDRLS